MEINVHTFCATDINYRIDTCAISFFQASESPPDMDFVGVIAQIVPDGTDLNTPIFRYINTIKRFTVYCITQRILAVSRQSRVLLNGGHSNIPDEKRNEEGMPDGITGVLIQTHAGQAPNLEELLISNAADIVFVQFRNRTNGLMYSTRSITRYQGDIELLTRNIRSTGFTSSLSINGAQFTYVRKIYLDESIWVISSVDVTTFGLTESSGLRKC